MSTAYGKTNNMIVYPTHGYTKNNIQHTKRIYTVRWDTYFVLKDTSGNILFWYADMDNDRAQDELTYTHTHAMQKTTCTYTASRTQVMTWYSEAGTYRYSSRRINKHIYIYIFSC